LIEKGVDTGKYLALDFFNGTWQQVLALRGNVDPENTWHHETVSVASNYLVNDFMFRFRGKASKTTSGGLSTTSNSSSTA
jgi:hypothetical protein